jgi:hypothetical protein
MAAARRAAADFLSALGIAVDREDLRETLLPFFGSRTSATWLASASSGCPSWPTWWSSSRQGRGSRNG